MIPHTNNVCFSTYRFLFERIGLSTNHISDYFSNFTVFSIDMTLNFEEATAISKHFRMRSSVLSPMNKKRLNYSEKQPPTTTTEKVMKPRHNYTGSNDIEIFMESECS